MAEAPLVQLRFVIPIEWKPGEPELKAFGSAFDVIFNVVYLIRAETYIESRANLKAVTDESPILPYTTIATCNGVRRADVPYEHAWNTLGVPIACIVDPSILITPLPEAAWHA